MVCGAACDTHLAELLLTGGATITITDIVIIRLVVFMLSRPQTQRRDGSRDRSREDGLHHPTVVASITSAITTTTTGSESVVVFVAMTVIASILSILFIVGPPQATRHPSSVASSLIIDSIATHKHA